MGNEPKYYVVKASALPEIFLKVAEVKRRLAADQNANVSTVTREMGISRSAFYKYKDAVRPFTDLMAGRIITFQFTLQDDAGSLSRLLRLFAEQGANILTINQTIPVGGVASVTVTAETGELACPVETLVARAAELGGVCSAEILAG